MQKIFIFFGAVLSIAAVFVFWPKAPTPLTLRSEHFSRTERIAAVTYFTDLLQEQTPSQVMHQLREQAARDQRLLHDCHTITHEIGHRSFEKYQDFGSAMRYRDEFCNAGYIHGVIESTFSTTDFDPTLLNVCDDQPAGLPAWECFHGIGHGLMYMSTNDLPWALDTCQQLPEEHMRSCQNGVFMENFAGDDLAHQSRYRSRHDPLYPCLTFMSGQRVDCLIYAPTYFLTLHPGDYAGVFAMCDPLSGTDYQYCIFGVASQLAKENLGNLSTAAAWCRAHGGRASSACFTGLFQYVITHAVGNRTEALELCRSFSIADRATCQQAIHR